MRGWPIWARHWYLPGWCAPAGRVPAGCMGCCSWASGVLLDPVVGAHAATRQRRTATWNAPVPACTDPVCGHAGGRRCMVGGQGGGFLAAQPAQAVPEGPAGQQDPRRSRRRSCATAVRCPLVHHGRGRPGCCVVRLAGRAQPRGPRRLPSSGHSPSAMRRSRCRAALLSWTISAQTSHASSAGPPDHPGLTVREVAQLAAHLTAHLPRRTAFDTRASRLCLAGPVRRTVAVNPGANRRAVTRRSRLRHRRRWSTRSFGCFTVRGPVITEVTPGTTAGPNWVGPAADGVHRPVQRCRVRTPGRHGSWSYGPLAVGDLPW